MKKLLTILLCLLALFAFASCSGDTPDAPSENTNTKRPLDIDESFWGTYKFANDSGNAIRITKTTFEIGNLLSGEFTATSRIEDLYNNLAFDKSANFPRFDQYKDHYLYIYLNAETSYGLTFKDWDTSKPVYEMYSQFDKWKKYDLVKID